MTPSEAAPYPPREHREFLHIRRLRRWMVSSVLWALFAVLVAIGLWATAWHFWPEMIARRLPWAVAFAVAAASGGWALLDRQAPAWVVWVFLISAAATLAYCYEATEFPWPRWRRPRNEMAVVILLFALTAVCAAVAEEHIRSLAREIVSLRTSLQRIQMDADAAQRPARLMETLGAVGLAWNGEHPEQIITRLIHFGDAERDPGNITVWAVHDSPDNEEWLTDEPAGGSPLGALARRVDWALERIGFPSAVDVGVAAETEIAAAGGDAAYFGSDGRRQQPQEPRKPGPDG